MELTLKPSLCKAYRLLPFLKQIARDFKVGLKSFHQIGHDFIFFFISLCFEPTGLFIYTIKHDQINYDALKGKILGQRSEAKNSDLSCL